MALCACGDNSKLTQTEIPDALTEGPVRIETNPLRLVVGDDFEQTAFLEIGAVPALDPQRYYNPLATDSIVSWHTPSAASSYDQSANAIGVALASGIEITIALEPSSDASVATLRIDADSSDNVVLARLVFPRLPGEAIFGFGETFDSAVADNAVREMQLRIQPQSESGLNEVHVPIPLVLWPARGVGAFVDDPRPAAFDVGAERDDAVLATFALTEPGPLRTHIFVADQGPADGADPLSLCRRYAALTALPAVPPRWAFTPQQWRNEHNSSAEVRDDASQMRSLDIPGSVMWIDNPWQTDYNTFEFDEARFDGSEALLGELNDLGYRVLVWSTPYINRNGLTEPDFLEARDKEYLVTDRPRRPFIFPWQDGPGGLFDFSREGATAWWQQRISRATAIGISGFKLDFGEDLVPEIAGSLTPFMIAAGSAQQFHARYAELYHRAYFDALPEGDRYLITRAGAPGEQAVNPSIWPGDLDSDFSRHGDDNGEGKLNVGGLSAAIAGGLSLSVSGYPFYGSDIGGFREGPPTTEVLLRWAQYAAFGTIMQLGGGGPSHNPWDATLYDSAIAVPIYRRYARVHMSLIPSLQTWAKRAGADGTPITVPTRFLHPDAQSDDSTFIVAESLFVAPVIEAGAETRDVVLPPGTWVDYWTGELVQADGATVFTAAAPIETIPVWQRVGKVIALYTLDADTTEPVPSASTVRSYSDPIYGRELTFRYSPDDVPAQFATFDGSSIEASLSGGSGYSISVASGTEFSVFTIELLPTLASPGAVRNLGAATKSGAEVVEVASRVALLACDPNPGCRFTDATSGRLWIRTNAGSVDLTPAN